MQSIVFYKLANFLNLFLPLLISIAFYTLIERQIMGAIQRRLGPTVVGFQGILQPIADGVKLLLKEFIFISSANISFFFFGPFLALFLSLLNWSFFIFAIDIYKQEYSLTILYIMCISSVAVYSLVIAGWASNNKYAFLAAMRSIAQMISYEVILSVFFLVTTLLTASLSFRELLFIQGLFNSCYFILGLPLFFIFYISILAETNRVPFDLPEAEAELVAGYNLEYSSMAFAMFFLAEYGNMLFMSYLCILIFFGSIFKVISYGFVWVFLALVISISFITVRALLPRYRYDQLMVIGWKRCMPLIFGFCIFLLTFFLLLDVSFNLDFLSFFNVNDIIPASQLSYAFISSFN